MQFVDAVTQVRKTPRWHSSVGPTSAFMAVFIPTGIHGPTCILGPT
jgi:hypothetical protein